MKAFRRFVTELFDRKIPVNPFSMSDLSWGYNFVLFSDGGKNKVAPTGKDLEKFVDDWFKAKGIDMASEPRDKRAEHLSLFNQEFKAVIYTINFDNIRFEKAYNELALISRADIRYDVWELSFVMRKADLQLRTIGRPSVSGRYYWHGDVGTDDDINQFSAADAAMILGAVTDAAKDFVKRMKPRGIILGTKLTANPARGRIYKAIARAAARETGGEFHELDEPRAGMANGAIVWYDKDDRFDG